MFPSGYHVPKGAALQQLGDEIGEPVLAADVVDREKIRVIERGSGLGFALESTDAIGIRRERVEQDLDRDLPVELCIASTIDGTHASGAQQLQNLIPS